MKKSLISFAVLAVALFANQASANQGLVQANPKTLSEV